VRERLLAPLIARLPFEDYLLGIGEVPSSWPKEALRAQAVAARSFALYKIRKYGLQPTCNCHLTDGSNDQVYIGWDKEGGLDGQRWVKAVRSTTGVGRDVQGRRRVDGVHGVDGGHTEDLNVQWGTRSPRYRTWQVSATRVTTPPRTRGPIGAGSSPRRTHDGARAVHRATSGR
jgi:SpoIID/LytB domain protein